MMRVEQKEEKKVEPFVAPQPMGKVILIAVLVITSSALFWLAWFNALTTGITFDLGAKNIITVVSTLLAFCLMFTILALAEVLVTKNLILLGTVILAAGTVFVFFTPSLWSFIGFLLIVLGFLYWRREIRLDMKSRTKFIPQRVIKNGLRGVVTLLLLATSFIYYSYTVTQIDADNKLADSLARTAASGINAALEGYYGESYNSEMILDDFIINFSEAALGQDIDDFSVETGQPKLDDIIKEGITAAQDDLIAESRDGFLETFGITASGDETMKEIVSKIVTKNLNTFIDPYKKFLPVLLALSLFFLMQFFGFIYREMIKSLSFLLFHVLKWLYFIQIKKIQVEAERVTL